jgi:hypothetical protein
VSESTDFEFGIKDFYNSSTKPIFLEAALMLRIFRQALRFVITQVALRKRVIKNVSNDTNFNK